MPSRGLIAAAALIGVALAALARLRQLERERRLMARLGQAGELAVDALSDEEMDAVHGLQRSGVLQIQGRRVLVKPRQLAAFRTRRVRAVLSGGFIALVLAIMVVLVVLRR